MNEKVFIEKLLKRDRLNQQKWTKKEVDTLIQLAKSEEAWINVGREVNNDNATIIFQTQQELNDKRIFMMYRFKITYNIIDYINVRSMDIKKRKYMS